MKKIGSSKNINEFQQEVITLQVPELVIKVMVWSSNLKKVIIWSLNLSWKCKFGPGRITARQVEPAGLGRSAPRILQFAPCL